MARRESIAQQYGCLHPEAFCLMAYEDTQGNREIVWNSQDQVTPFGMTSVQGFESKHVDWNQDRFMPHHMPAIGSRIFVAMTPTRARETSVIWYDRFAANETYGADFREQFAHRDRAILEHALTRLDDHCPDIIIVTESTLERLEFMRPPFLKLYLANNPYRPRKLA